MKTFYGVTIFAFLAGMLILCFFAPWTSTPPGSSAVHDSLGYAAIWSQHFAAVAGARVDTGAFAILAGVVAFFAIVIGGASYFFRNKRGNEREDV
jgi:cytochrome bd-type quinol oxidase subunit 1